MRIVDAHHHLWDLNALRYPWLTDRVEPKPYGDYAAFRRDYPIEEFLADVDSSPVTRSVHLAAESTDDLGESRWVRAIAEDRDRSRGFPHAIVAGADLTGHDPGRELAEQASIPGVVGIRQIISGSVTAGRRDLTADPGWHRSIGLLERHGFSLDLQVHPTQLGTAVDVARSHPATTVVLDHCALVNRHDPELLALWRKGIAEAARCPNVRMKISAFMIYDLHFTVSGIRPLVHEMVDAFGPDRCLFASNYPVDSLACSYAELWARYAATVDDLTDDERDRLFYRTAATTYRIEDA